MEAFLFAPSLPAVLLASFSAFVLGGLWYSPLLFGKSWQRLSKLSDADLQGGMGRIFGLAFVLLFVAAWVFAMFLGPDPDIPFATLAGLGAGLFWVAASMGVNDLFERRPVALWAINAGYHTLVFTLFGLVIGWIQ
jgi:hypothetical protein